MLQRATMVFSVEQKAFMLESYFGTKTIVNGQRFYSIQTCVEEFQVQYPNVVIDYQQFKKTLDRMVDLFRETGSILRKPGSGAPKKRTAEVVAVAQEVMDNAPKTSVRRLSQQINLAVGTTHKLLHKDLHLYPYRVTVVQELKPADYPLRLNFCNWTRAKIENDPEFLQRIIFSDESWFYISGYVNSQNMRTWSAENPHEIIQEPLHAEKIGVWAGFSHGRVIGPIFFNGITKNNTQLC